MSDETAGFGPQRRRESSIWAREAHDWYVEPEWCSARLFEEESFTGNVHDPACGMGNIVKSARAAGIEATGGDVVSRGPYCQAVEDWCAADVADLTAAENIVSNPPFKLCDDRAAGTFPFVERCLLVARRKVALLLPANWIQGDRRSRWLDGTPLRRVWFISPRPSMPPGHVIAAGAKPSNGKTDYAWLVWLHGYDGAPEVRWLRRQK